VTAGVKTALALAWAAFVIALALIVFQGVPLGLSKLYGEGALLAIGSLLVLRRPGNVIGSILVAMGAVWTVVIAADVSAETLAERGNESAASWIALIFMIVTIPMLWLGNIAIWLIFPDGRPATARGALFLRVSAGYTAVLTIVHIVARPRILSQGEPSYPHPFIDNDFALRVGDVLDVLTIVLLFLGGFLAGGMLIGRARHSDPVERRQIAWVGLGYIVSNIMILVGSAFDPLAPLVGEENRAWVVFDSLAFLTIALTLGVAIMKYRLYDIDVIISKSVMYLGLLASITAVYAAVVVVPLLVIGTSDGDGPGLLLPIVATGAVAVSFEPIRSRMQRWANRLVYGNRSTPHEVLSQVTARLAESTGASTDELARLVAMGTGADQAVVSIVTDSGTIPTGRWSVNTSSTAALTESGELTAVVDVLHEGERLGTVSITKPPNDPITPADQELLDDVAAGAGLLLRNIRLNKELEDRAAEVRESRRRLIEAQDRERHRLERDLHDGAQQQVVALKVKLGIAKTVAQRENAPDIADHLIGLADISQVAVDALRHVAHGIYPPLLESEGLEPALRAVGRTSALPIELNAVDIDRYARSTEETAYFCVTETLERARMSGARSARVAVAGRSGDLITSIDLGSLDTELDLRAVADRLDAAGGSMTIEDQPERGRCVVSSLPVAPFEGETS
jgi:signal transduction histidine kinase